jgi:hypothetical protein
MSPRRTKSAVDKIVLPQLGVVVQFFATERVDEAAEELRCRTCSRTFHVCVAHYRGQGYCGDVCRRAGRRLCVSAARMRHQRSEEGAADHRDRNREYRLRRRRRVMDQRSQKLDSAVKSAPETIAAEEQRAPRRGFVICVVCGAELRLIVVRRRRRRGRDPP